MEYISSFGKVIDIFGVLWVLSSITSYNVWVGPSATSCDIRESRTDNGYTDTHTDNVRWMGYH